MTPKDRRTKAELVAEIARLEQAVTDKQSALYSEKNARRIAEKDAGALREELASHNEAARRVEEAIVANSPDYDQHSHGVAEGLGFAIAKYRGHSFSPLPIPEHWRADLLAFGMSGLAVDGGEA